MRKLLFILLATLGILVMWFLIFLVAIFVLPHDFLFVGALLGYCGAIATYVVVLKLKDY